MRIIRIFLPVFLIALFLQGCSGGGYNTHAWESRPHATPHPAEHVPDDIAAAPAQQETMERGEQLPPVKVAILLPLTGPHKKLGQAMLNAAQMALFEIGFDSFQLLPKDTQGTPGGARNAAHDAVRSGAGLVLGPVFAPSVRAARPVTQKANINMIAFSTDWTLASGRTFLIGFLPFDQIGRIAHYATRKGYRRIGVLSPADTYGNGVISAWQAAAQSTGVQAARSARFAPNGGDLGTVLRKFSDYDARKAQQNAHGAPFDAVLMPVGGQLARQAGNFLNHYDLPPRTVKRLGTGLMDDASLAREPSLDGAWFAAPAPQTRGRFERRYRDIYFAAPPRIASLSYDATALAAILARTGLRQNGVPAFDHRSITNPNGFSGVDGIFRFRTNGTVERGLAVLEYRNGTLAVIEPAPKTFQRGAF